MSWGIRKVLWKKKVNQKVQGDGGGNQKGAPMLDGLKLEQGREHHRDPKLEPHSPDLSQP